MGPRRHHDEDEFELLETEVKLLREIRHLLHRLVAMLSPPQSSTATLSTQGEPVSTLTLDFVDASGTPQPAPKGDGSGLAVTFTSDGTTSPGSAVAGTNGSGFVNYSAPLTVVDDGSASNLTAVVANVSGAPLNDDDGVTLFVQPAALAFTAPAPPPAQATTGVLSVA
jgi:hypothetical protein